LQKVDRAVTPVDEKDKPQRAKRSSLFRRGSRHDSLSSEQSSLYGGGGGGGGHDQIGHLPVTNVAPHSSASRPSRDVLLRAPTTPEQPPPAEGKKKRFSGLKFFKGGGGGGSTKAAATEPTPPQDQTSSNRPDAPFFTSPHQGYATPAPYGQFTDIPGGFFDRDAGQYPPAEVYPPPQQQRTQYPAVLSPYRHHSTSYPPEETTGTSPSYPTDPPMTDPSPYVQNAERPRPSDLRIDTGGGGGGGGGGRPTSYGFPATAPAQIYPPRDAALTAAAAAAAATARPYSGENTDPNWARAVGPPNAIPSAVAAPSVNPPPKDRSHVLDLHKRSRSPRLGRRSEDDDDDDDDGRSGSARPVGGVTKLGTFSGKRISPVGGVPRSEGDQERPYAIVIPGLDDGDDEERRRKPRRRVEGGQAAIPDRTDTDTPVSVATTEDEAPPPRDVLVSDRPAPAPAGQGQAQGRSDARDRSSGSASGGFVAELPGSHAEGYSSEEEIAMSATAYPGQEWMPVVVGDGRWDD
jgi:hypothetical protein